MKKLTKLVAALAAMTLALTCLTACSDDGGGGTAASENPAENENSPADDPETGSVASIVGTWKGDMGTLVINANKTGTYTKGSTSNIASGSVTWSGSGSSYTITFSSGSITATISGSTMTTNIGTLTKQ